MRTKANTCLIAAFLLMIATCAHAQGTTNFISKFVDPSNLGDSSLFDNGISIGFGTTSPGIAHPNIPTFTLLNGLNPSFLELASNTTNGALGTIYFIAPSSTDTDRTMAFITATVAHPGLLYSGSLYFGTKQLGGVAKSRMTIGPNGNIGIGTTAPLRFVSLGGGLPRNLGMDPNPTPGGFGQSLTINAGAPNAGASDTRGGDLLLASGTGTGLGGSGNTRIQTAGAEDVSGTTGNTVVDREIMVGKAKQLTLGAPGFTSLMSIHLTGTHTAGGRIFYTVRATDGGSQIATEEGVIQYLATANSITCTVQTADKLHLGTVNSGCTPGFFNPGSQPGISIFDNVSFSSPAPIVVHEVYFKVENESGSSVRLEP